MMKFKCPLISAAVTAALFIGWMITAKMAPFGANVVMLDDAQIQYLDFFAWGKHILNGDASPFFSFNKGLGGPAFAVFSYYLLSPLNLLLIFFNPEKIPLFYHLATVLKLVLCAFVSSLYLGERFNLKSEWKIMLSAGFALSVPIIEQIKNLMWLDAIYMLPLIMFFIYRYCLGKHFAPIVIAMTFAMITNWYQGFIVLMFAFIFSIVDFVFFQKEQVQKREIFQFASKMAGFITLAVAFSSVVLVPTFAALSLGRGGIDIWAFEWRFFNSFYMLFNGMFSENKNAIGFFSYYGGELMMFSMIAFFFKFRGKKLWGGILIVILIYLMYYFKPLFFLFSLLKAAQSYFFRHGYLAVFMAMFLAANFLQTFEVKTNYRRIIIAICAVFLFNHTSNFMKHETAHDFIPLNENYVLGEKRALSALKSKDASPYRISQTLSMPVYTNTKFIIPPRCKFNEGLAYNYMTLETYTSSPNNKQMELLDALGYRINSENFNIYAMPLLPSDSLLGVKYVRSHINIGGLVLLDEFAEENNKKVYFNPYAMPMVFAVKTLITDIPKSEDSMENNNYIFNVMFNENVYKKLQASERKVDSEEIIRLIMQSEDANKSLKIYGYSVANDSNMIYGVIPTHETLKGNIFMNGKLYARAQDWTGLSAFYAPAENKISDIVIFTERPMKEIRFYEVDEAALKRASDKANKRAAEILEFTSTSVKFRIKGKGGEFAFTSFPYVKNAKVTRNGENIKMVENLKALAAVELVDGENVVEIRY